MDSQERRDLGFVNPLEAFSGWIGVEYSSLDQLRFSLRLLASA